VLVRGYSTLFRDMPIQPSSNNTRKFVFEIRRRHSSYHRTNTEGDSGQVVERLEDRFEHLSLTLSRVKRELLLKAASLQHPAELCDIKSPKPGPYSLDQLSAHESVSILCNLPFGLAKLSTDSLDLGQGTGHDTDFSSALLNLFLNRQLGSNQEVHLSNDRQATRRTTADLPSALLHAFYPNSSTDNTYPLGNSSAVCQEI
jgi:hypothetical protein